MLPKPDATPLESLERFGGCALSEARPWSLRGMLRALDDSGAEVAHLQYPSRGFGRRLGPVLLPLWLRLVRRRVSSVVTLHEFRRAHPLRKLAGLVATLPAHAVILPTSRGQEWIFRLRGRRRPTYVLPCGAATVPHPRPMDPIPGRLFHYGHPVPSKGLDLLIGALGRLRERLAGVSLELVCGSPSETRRLQRLAEQCRVADRIIWRGWLEDEALRMAAGRAEALVFPFREGFSLDRSSALNLLACGAPLVTTRGEPVLPLLACRPDSEAALAARLEDLFAHLHGPEGSKVRSDLASLQRSLAAHFSFGRLAEAHAAIYRGLRRAGAPSR